MFEASAHKKKKKTQQYHSFSSLKCKKPMSKNGEKKSKKVGSYYQNANLVPFVTVFLEIDSARKTATYLHLRPSEMIHNTFNKTKVKMLFVSSSSKLD